MWYFEIRICPFSSPKQTYFYDIMSLFLFLWWCGLCLMESFYGLVHLDYAYDLTLSPYASVTYDLVHINCVLWPYPMTLSISTAFWPYPMTLSISTVSYGHTIWPCPYQLCLMTIPYDLVHINCFLWPYHMTLSISTVLWRYPMTFSISTALWPYHMTLSISTVLWPYSMT